MPDADLWEHYVSNNVPTDSATNLVKQRKALSPADTWEHLVNNGMSPDSATSLVSKATGAQPAAAGGADPRAQAYFDHAANAAAFGFGPQIVGAAQSVLHGKGLDEYAANRDAIRQQLASEEAGQKGYSAGGSVTGALASPVNALLPGGPGIAGGIKTGAAGAALAGAGNANAPDGSAPSLMDRLKAALVAAPVGAVTGGVLGGATGFLGKGLKAGPINSEIQSQAAANPSQVEAAYNRLRAQPPVSDPTVVSPLNALVGTRSGRAAYVGGQGLAEASGQPIPNLPPVQAAGSQTGASVLSPAETSRLSQVLGRAPTAEDIAKMLAANPDIAARAGGSATQGSAAAGFDQWSPSQIDYLKRGIREAVVNKTLTPNQADVMEGVLMKHITRNVDPAIPAYPDARGQASKGFALQELQGQPQGGLGNAPQILAGAGKVAFGSPVSKAAGLMKIMQAAQQSGGKLSPEAQELLDQISGKVSGTPMGMTADALSHMGRFLPQAAIAAAGEPPYKPTGP